MQPSAQSVQHERYSVILLIGPPGTGKGTQGGILGAVPGFYYFGMGETLRSLDPDSPQGRRIAPYLRSGKLAPAKLVTDLWKREIEDRINRGQYQPDRETLILDGIPRTIEQAKRLDRRIVVKAVIEFVCRRKEELVERLRQRRQVGSRADDQSDELIQHRFEVYYQRTAPLLKYYPQRLVIALGAEGTPLEVFLRLGKTLLEAGTSPANNITLRNPGDKDHRHTRPGSNRVS